MKRKRFIKLMRSRGFSKDFINADIDWVKRGYSTYEREYNVNKLMFPHNFIQGGVIND